MTLPAHDGEDRLLGVPTANDRLKAGRSATLHRSILGSVLIHVAVILGWPETTLPTLASGGGTESGHLQLISLGSLSTPGPARPIAPTVVEDGDLDDPDPQDLGSEEGEDVTGEGGGAPEGWEGRSAELWRLAALRPTMAEPMPEARSEARSNSVAESGEDPSDGDDPEGLRIREGSEDLAFQRLSEEEMLSLERLSALRPELVLVSPSNWLVVRNPREVGDYLRDHFDYDGIDPETGGSLSVSLWVDERGSVEWAEINSSSGHAPIDASAIRLFEEVVAFRPAREDGARVPVAAIFWLMW